MIIHNFDPILVDLGFLQIRLYSLSYIFGIIFGWIYAKKLLIKDEKINKTFDDLITYIILGIIIGYLTFQYIYLSQSINLGVPQ